MTIGNVFTEKKKSKTKVPSDVFIGMADEKKQETKNVKGRTGVNLKRRHSKGSDNLVQQCMPGLSHLEAQAGGGHGF